MSRPKLKITDGPIPGRKQIIGLPFHVSFAIAGRDVTPEMAAESIEAAELMLELWNSPSEDA